MARRLASLAAIIAVLFFAVASAAEAHQAPSGWDYPLECCSQRDCARVDASAVKEQRGGWHVTVAPGSHPMVPADGPPVVTFIAIADARPSPDGDWHICLHPTDKRVLCFFAPPGGV